MQQDVPYLPELPGELMLDTALNPISAPHLAAFGEALRVIGKARFAKAQLAGPVTLAAHTRVAGAAERVAAKAVMICRSLQLANVTPIIFLDEPGLGLGAFSSAPLELVRHTASEAGALVGLHCCAQTRWAELLALDFDVISLDARLSLDALLEDRRAWLSFLERGGTLCLGIIPTNGGARYEVSELCESVEASLRATTPAFEQALSRMMLSAACGLVLHTAEDALRISAEVQEAQARLRSLI